MRNPRSSSVGFSEGAELSAWRLVTAPTAARRFARILMLGFAVLVVALIFVPWQQTARGTGRLVAFSPVEREQKIGATVTGRVVKWHVQEGTRVKRGQVIAEIADLDPNLLRRLESQRTALQAGIAALQARARAIDAGRRRLQGARFNAVSAAKSRMQMARDKVRAAQRKVVAASAAHRAARLNLARQRELFREGLTSRRSLELAQMKEATTAAKVEQAQAARGAAEADARAKVADRETISFSRNASIESARAKVADVFAKIASARASLTKLDTQIARQQSQQITSPRSGSIFRIFAKEGGEVVKAGTVLAILIPETVTRAVELWMDGNDLPLLTVGRKVRLQFEGWPALQFSGWPSVAFGTFGGEVAVIDSTDNGKGEFRILVRPDPQDEPWPQPRYLRQGVRANGWVLLDVVSLGYELWRRFNGFPPVLSRPEGKPGGKGKQAKPVERAGGR